MQVLKQLKVHLCDGELNFKVGEMNNGSWVKGIRVTDDNHQAEIEYSDRKEVYEDYKLTICQN